VAKEEGLSFATFFLLAAIVGINISLFIIDKISNEKRNFQYLLYYSFVGFLMTPMFILFFPVSSWPLFLYVCVWFHFFYISFLMMFEDYFLRYFNPFIWFYVGMVIYSTFNLARSSL